MEKSRRIERVTAQLPKPPTGAGLLLLAPSVGHTKSSDFYLFHQGGKGTSEGAKCMLGRSEEQKGLFSWGWRCALCVR